MEEARRMIISEAAKCTYCGFCEAVCPTARLGPHRGYGPRGRLAVAAHLASGGAASPEALASIYSCLTCRACTLKCPQGIDVAEVVKAARSLYVSGLARPRVSFTVKPRR